MTRLKWEKEAEAALKTAPLFVRPLVRRKVEERVAAQGGKEVRLVDFREAESRFKAMRAGKSDAELEKMLPQTNRAGVEMVVINTCHSQLSNCPNVLINTDDLNAKLSRRLKEEKTSERLRGLVDEDKVLFHHKLKISISGCANGCSRPQIADFGFLGAVRPVFDLADCTGCGACEEACPDGAIRLENALPLWDKAACLGCLKCSQACPVECIRVAEPFFRLISGGKLGRHPHLAEPVGEFNDADEAIDKMAAEIEDYLAGAEPGERFANWRLRSSDPKLTALGGVQ